MFQFFDFINWSRIFIKNGDLITDWLVLLSKTLVSKLGDRIPDQLVKVSKKKKKSLWKVNAKFQLCHYKSLLSELFEGTKFVEVL